jgi:hypothetical protein
MNAFSRTDPLLQRVTKLTADATTPHTQTIQIRSIPIDANNSVGVWSLRRKPTCSCGEFPDINNNSGLITS